MTRPRSRQRAINHAISQSDGRCHYCRLTVDETVMPPHPRARTVDHIVPTSKGGKWANNLVLACYRCNSQKGTMSADEFLALRKQRMLGGRAQHALQALKNSAPQTAEDPGAQ